MAEAPGTSTAAPAAAVAAPSDNNQALHKAIEEGDMETFLDLLHQPGVDLNYKHERETPLTASIRNHNSRMAKKLIETGCDVHLRNDRDQSPLYLAVMGHNIVDVTVVEMLLRKGADPNEIFPDYFYTQTSLHEATEFGYSSSSNTLEVTSMLLYFGADVDITNSYNRTPLHMAVDFARNSCAEVLLNFYDDFSNRSSFRRTVLHDAIKKESPLVPALLERGADVNSLTANCMNCLDLTVLHYNATLFKYIWSRMSHHLLIKTYNPFLNGYIQYSRFANWEYLECLYLMLESPTAQDLMDKCIYKTGYHIWDPVQILLLGFLKRKLLPKERLSAIYTCLSFGIKIETKDLVCAIENYGFNEEFKALLYAGDFDCCDCIKQIKYFKQSKANFYLKGFSSFSFENKQHVEAVNELLATSSALESETMLEALSKVPKFPSLLELSRNVAQKFIEQEFSVTKLYQLYDAVACLNLPQTLRDVILLERPIYDDVTGIK